MREAIRIRREILAEMLAHAEREAQRECCGLLAGRDGAISEIFSAGNASENPATSYEIAPADLFRMMRAIRAARLDLLGIYHSHPQGDNFPSALDVERAFYPDAAYFVVSPRAKARNPVRAFWIRDAVATELSVETF
ncbi:MAG TPA: M67 family metallopeptidase [Candidatus Acidoferrales bacterium]|nr:M67 family metallopeptidase [Candidatus Acidoferrales bacterium]